MSTCIALQGSSAALSAKVRKAFRLAVLPGDTIFTIAMIPSPLIRSRPL
jgi:hypothetical protein